MRLLLLLFVIIPIIEMWILIEVGSKLGVLITILLVFLTGIIGVVLLRHQGMNTLLRVNQQMEQGQLPVKEILEGVMLAIGGALLLTPGFITDTIGFTCLFPITRRLLVAGLLRQRMVMARYGGKADFTDTPFQQFKREKTAQIRPKDQSGTTIEGEFTRDDKT